MFTRTCITAFACLGVFVSGRAAATETVAVTPVEIETLDHYYDYDTFLDETRLWDGVNFPCGPGDCDGPGFTASLGTGDTIVVRFEAPAGKRFAVTHTTSGITQKFLANAWWSTGVGDTVSTWETGTLTFENLMGTAPTINFCQAALSDNGESILAQAECVVTADCWFTAVEIELTVSHSVPDVSRTYGTVNTYSSPSYGSSLFDDGYVPDHLLMALVPDAEDVPVAPVEIETLTHSYSYNSLFDWTTIRDGVDFPCAPGDCAGPGFTASVGIGDTIVARFEAPVDHKFVITHAAAGQTFWVDALWKTGAGDTYPGILPATVGFENLSGVPPIAPNPGFIGVTDNAEEIFLSQSFSVTGDCEFTAMEIRFSVPHVLADVARTYGAVNTSFTPSFASGVVILGTAPDQTIMEIVPVTTCPEDLTGDGSVNVTDLLQLLSGWGTCGG